MKATKKAVTVEAVKFIGVVESEEGEFGLQFEESPDWIGDHVELGNIMPTGQFSKTADVITDSHGTCILNPGDYLIMGVEGEIYPCKASVFEKTYSSEKEEEK